MAKNNALKPSGNGPQPLTIEDVTLAAPIKITEEQVNELGIQINWHYVSYDDYALHIRFRVPLGLITDYQIDGRSTFKKTEQRMREFAEDKICELGIPNTAHRRNELNHTHFGSTADVDCVFFLEEEKLQFIDPAIRAGIEYEPGSWSVRAPRAFVLNTKLPREYITPGGRNTDQKIDDFGRYVLSVLPWQVQWLIEWSLFVDAQDYDDDIIFIFYPPTLSGFTHEEPSLWPAEIMLLYQYTLHPQIL